MIGLDFTKYRNVLPKWSEIVVGELPYLHLFGWKRLMEIEIGKPPCGDALSAFLAKLLFDKI